MRHNKHKLEMVLLIKLFGRSQINVLSARLAYDQAERLAAYVSEAEFEYRS
jgi:hypothetical protein